MNPVLRVHFHQEMHMIGHDFQPKQLGIGFSADILDNCLKPGINPVDQYGAAVLRTPDNMIFTGVNHVVM
jgi:hypothetical protein